MADANTASSTRNRLTRNRFARQRPEVRLARDLIKTDHQLGKQRGEEGPADLGTEIADLWRRLMDRIRGRSAPAPAGGGGGVGGGASGGGDGGGWSGYPQGEPQQSAGAGMSVHEERMIRLESQIKKLSPRQHEAFEDAVLNLVRTDKKWQKVFEESPETIPTVVRFAGNAQRRELLRDAPPTAADLRATADLREQWERPAPAVGSSIRSGFQGPGQNEFSGGHEFEVAAQTNLRESTTHAVSTPRRGELTDGHTFVASEHRHILDDSASESAFVTNSPLMSPVSLPTSPELHTRSIDIPQSMLDSEGRSIVREAYDSPLSPTTPRPFDVPSNTASPQHVQAKTQGRARK
ncbi:hypothetical protein [Streptomyces sp. NBC_00370]|uniref:hypothetical protein n=1 Tax=Streptomyces sp. NBC_00370 TaxID=2975728 RepID=UPI002E269D96